MGDICFQKGIAYNTPCTVPKVGPGPISHKDAKPKETFKERKKRERPDWTEKDYQEYLDATSK